MAMPRSIKCIMVSIWWLQLSDVIFLWVVHDTCTSAVYSYYSYICYIMLYNTLSYTTYIIIYIMHMHEYILYTAILYINIVVYTGATYCI